MNIIYEGNIGRVGFTLAQGDLFEARVDVIVNSEQSNFVLAFNRNSISGQIQERYGRVVQTELDLATKMEVFRAGTVIGTTCGGGFKRIYHAGVHEPGDWPGSPGCSSYGQLLEIVGLCVDQVLQMAATEGVKSVAFPLLGCGMLGLDERMLVAQFLNALERLDRRPENQAIPHVWLVIRDPVQAASVVGKLIGLLIEYRASTISISLPVTGVPVLDRFADNLSKPAHESWANWQMCRFAEIALEILCYGLCRAIDHEPTPEALFEEGKAATFGVVREHALKLAAESPARPRRAWGAEFFARVLTNKTSARNWEVLNGQRNNLAHGRQSLSFADTSELVTQSLQLNEWATIPRTNGELRFGEWLPWVLASSAATGKTGLFERWQKNVIRYLVPETGEVFKVPRARSATT